MSLGVSQTKIFVMSNSQAAGNSGKDGNDGPYAKLSDYETKKIKEAEKNLLETCYKKYNGPPSDADMKNIARAFTDNGNAFGKEHREAEKNLPQELQGKDDYTIMCRALNHTAMQIAKGFDEEEKAKSK